MDSFYDKMKASRFWLSGLLVAALGFAIWKASGMIILIVSSIVISIFIESIAVYLAKYLRLPRFLSIILVFVGVIAIFALLIASAVPVFIRELSVLQPYIPDGDSVDRIIKALNLQSSSNADSFISFSPELISQVSGTAKSASTGVFKVVASTFGGFANVVLLGMMSLYLALEDRAIERLIVAVAPRRSEAYIASLWERVRSKTEGWFRGQLVVGLMVGTCTYIGLYFLNVPYSFLLAALAAILGIIPFGIIVAFLPALGIALSHGGVLTPVYVTILYGCIQYTSDYIIQPLVTKKVTGLPPLLVIISLVISVVLFGFLGFFISVPASIFLLEIVRDIEKKKGEHRLNEMNDSHEEIEVMETI